MKIHFEGFEMEFLRIEKKHEFPDFYFNHNSIHLVLHYRKPFGWRIGIGNFIKNPALGRTDFYQFIKKQDDNDKKRFYGEKLIRYLVLESPMRLQLLFKCGHDLLEKTIEKAKNES